MSLDAAAVADELRKLVVRARDNNPELLDAIILLGAPTALARAIQAADEERDRRLIQDIRDEWLTKNKHAFPIGTVTWEELKPLIAEPPKERGNRERRRAVKARRKLEEQFLS